jgi:hypothetical protein
MRKICGLCFLLLIAAAVWLHQRDNADLTQQPAAAKAFRNPAYNPSSLPPYYQRGNAAVKDRKRALGYFTAAFLWVAVGLGAWIVFQAVREFRQQGNWSAFIVPLVGVVVYLGFHFWTSYFADHGAFLTWPFVVAAVVVVLFVVRAFDLHIQNQKRIEDLKTMPPPPDTGGGPASKSDFKDW